MLKRIFSGAVLLGGTSLLVLAATPGDDSNAESARICDKELAESHWLRPPDEEISKRLSKERYDVNQEGRGENPALPAEESNEAYPSTSRTEFATFGMGCFWGAEADFCAIDGVVDTKVGYAAGQAKNPGYRDVSSGRTGHAEVVQVEYDPAKVSYKQLLDVFWREHDPTTLNRQGPDIGSQYRSLILYHSPEQRVAARLSLKRVGQTGRFQRPIVTQIEPAAIFYPAEEYHQRYLEKHGRARCRH